MSLLNVSFLAGAHEIRSFLYIFESILPKSSYGAQWMKSCGSDYYVLLCPGEGRLQLQERDDHNHGVAFLLLYVAIHVRVFRSHDRFHFRAH